MKFQQVLSLLLVAFVLANEDSEEKTGLLRGSAIRDSASSLDKQEKRADVGQVLFDETQRVRKAQFNIPTIPPKFSFVSNGSGNLGGFIIPISEESPDEPAEDPVPVDVPTEAPVDPPTETPVDPPTDAPVTPPTEAPIDPTNSPTSAPIPFTVGNRPAERPTISYPTVPPVDPPTRPTLDGIGAPAPTEPPVAPTPPIRQQTIDINGHTCGMSTSGTVILHGGVFNYDDPMSDSLGQALVREMRTNSDNRLVDPLVFVPGARQDVTDADEITFENQWRDIMAPGVPFTVLHADNEEPDLTNVLDAAQANTDGFVRPLRNAMGVFLPGGRQWRFIDAYKYTQTEEELWNVLNRGGVIAGTSAGAAVMASVMPRGNPAGSAAILADREWYQHGFGFVNNIAVDNHISTRGRELAMYDVLNDKPENRKILGIGLNENTMAIVKGRYFQVRGDRGPASVVRVYDCSLIPASETCTFENAPYTSLTPGNWYDLCERRRLFGPPSFNELDEDLGIRSMMGAYKRPWFFRNDFKSGNPSRFLCSGRRCTFKSSPVVVDSEEGHTVRISGKVYTVGSAFRSSDRLILRYSIGDDPIFKTVYDSSFNPGNYLGPFGQNVQYAFTVPRGKTTIHLEIEAETDVEGDAEYRVQDLQIV